MARKQSIIKQLDLEEPIIEDLTKNFLSISQIAEKYDLTYSQVHGFLVKNKLQAYDDEKLEAIAISEELNPLTVVQQFFTAVHHASKELNFTGIIALEYRKIIAEKVASQGVESLVNDEKLMKQWNDNTAKLVKLIEQAPKLLTAYIELFQQVLDVQREVSYVKVVTDLLRSQDPGLYKKLQAALAVDSTAKQVLDSLSRQDVLMYWDAEEGGVVRKEVSKENS